MLDVHPPHKAIHGVGEFFLHLFTITVGLLIAVGIEDLVTRHEHRELAEDARSMMTAEIRNNRSTLQDAMRADAEEEARLAKNIEMLKIVQLRPDAPEAKNMALDTSYNLTSLEFTAWHTAQETHALDYMPYTEAQKYSAIYEAANSFTTAEQQSTEDEAQILGIIRHYLPGDQPLSKQGADAMAQEFGVWQGHLLSLNLAARVLAEQTDAFLQGRKPKTNISEKLSR